MVGDTNHQYELCEEKMIKNGVGMIKKLMVKVAHPMQVYKKSLKFILFLGKKKLIMIWMKDKKAMLCYFLVSRCKIKLNFCKLHIL